MKIFLGWSGDLSHKVALALHDWLPSVIQAVKPFVSSEDIAKGARWSSTIAKELQQSNFGIICITKENVGSPWINFEAGALSKEIEAANVCPYLFNLRPSDVHGPLEQFQSVINEEEEVLKLIFSINDKLPEGQQLEKEALRKAFQMWWPELKGRLDALLKDEKPDAKPKPLDQSEMLDRLLMMVRAQQSEFEHRMRMETENRARETTALVAKLTELTSTVTAIGRSVESLHSGMRPEGGYLVNTLLKAMQSSQANSKATLLTADVGSLSVEDEAAMMSLDGYRPSE